jgi:hypothetical protein
MDVCIGTIAEPAEAKYKCLACGFILIHLFAGGKNMATVPQAEIMTYLGGDKTVIRPLKSWGVETIEGLRTKAKENCGHCYGRGYIGALTMPSGVKALMVCGCIIPKPVKPEAPELLREVDETIKKADEILDAIKGHQEAIDNLNGPEAKPDAPGLSEGLERP